MVGGKSRKRGEFKLRCKYSSTCEEPSKRHTEPPPVLQTKYCSRTPYIISQQVPQVVVASVEREHRRDIVVAPRESGGDLRVNKGGGNKVLWIDLRKMVAGKRARRGG
jgi:hypothetical protein